MVAAPRGYRCGYGSTVRKLPNLSLLRRSSQPFANPSVTVLKLRTSKGALCPIGPIELILCLIATLAFVVRVFVYTSIIWTGLLTVSLSEYSCLRSRTAFRVSDLSYQKTRNMVVQMPILLEGQLR